MPENEPRPEIPQDPPIEPVVNSSEQMPPASDQKPPVFESDATTHEEPAPDTNAEAAAVVEAQSPEQLPESPTTLEKLQWATDITETAASLRQSLEGRHRDIRSLAEASQEDLGLQGIIETKGIGKDFASPEELAAEIQVLEEDIIKPFIAKLETQGFTQEQKDQAILSIRESIYGLITSGLIKAEQLSEFISEIKIEENPTSSRTEELTGLKPAASFKIESNGDRYEGVITIYKEFLNLNEEQQTFLIRHEASHVLARGLWGADYEKFLNAAAEPTDEVIKAFSAYPELQQVLRVVQDPVPHRAAFREYIQKMIDKFAGSDEQTKKAIRKSIANEIVADLITHFVEAGNKPVENFSYRARYLNPEEIANYCFSALGAEEREDFFTKLELDENDRTPEKVVAALAKVTELEALFGINETWATKLKEKFANRGEKLVPLPENVSGDLDDAIGSSSSGGGNGSDGSVDRGVFSSGGKDPMEWFWTIVLGKGSGGTN